MEEYILVVLKEGGRIDISATGNFVITEKETAIIRDELLVKKQLEPNIQAILRRRYE